MRGAAVNSLNSKYLLLIVLLLSSVASCSKPTAGTNSPGSATTPTNVFDEYLRADFPPADGFDFPFGDGNGGGSYSDKATGKRYDGWYIATHFAENYSLGIHTGEDWNGNGGGNTDLGQDVFAVANGRVVFAENYGRLWGNVIVIEHVFYENHEKKKIRSLYAHLQAIKVREGERVRRRQLIATVGQDPDKLFQAHLHLELRWDESLAPTYWPSSNHKDVSWVKEHYTQPKSFIETHRKISIPQAEAVLVIVDQPSYKARLYQKGALVREYDVSFGQSSGPKQLQGDNKTPVGMYFVIQKHKGTFAGPYGEYYGGHWIKINYPNSFDAARASRQGLMNAIQAVSITKSWQERAPTLQNTALGGGIGFHGWIREWKNDGPRHLSWGCVVMHLSDVDKFFAQVPEGTMVVIF
ncbi:MAG TPA: peptidoglycan DD-metalloendopeptidase family protein [Pyrinomonadaceae bacterium]|jgi:murein DD-endopeptidase MepM/ murein hydrolase activator NlpD|nr:peptidoglycan DD-metalloendopeptidase family protein [Pyrinomonadaceae bacterium]